MASGLRAGEYRLLLSGTEGRTRRLRLPDRGLWQRAGVQHAAVGRARRIMLAWCADILAGLPRLLPDEKLGTGSAPAFAVRWPQRRLQFGQRYWRRLRPVFPLEHALRLGKYR